MIICDVHYNVNGSRKTAKFGTRTRVLKLAIKKEIKPVALCCDSTKNILRLPVSCNLLAKTENANSVFTRNGRSWTK